MTAMTNYTVNHFLVDNLFRGQTTAIPTSLFYGLFIASNGFAAVSTVYTTGQTVIPATPNGHLYKATTGGTSGGTAPTWPTTSGGTVTDGSVVWTEQTPSLLAGTFTEASYTGYGRVTQASSLADWSGTQSAGSTTASTGTSGQTSNNNIITFGAPTSAQTGIVVGMFLADASSAGNIIVWSMLTNPKTINNGDAAPNFPAAAFTITWA
jgi:hypothetical protein